MNSKKISSGGALLTPDTSNELTTDKPLYLRLPKAGRRCPYTGLSRSTINELILPTAENNFKPPVRSLVLRKKGASRGCRLVSFESLTVFLDRLADEANSEGPTTRSEEAMS